MCVAGEHNHGLDLLSANFIFQDLMGAFLAHLNQAVASHDYELLPLGVVPMLTFGDAGL